MRNIIIRFLSALLSWMDNGQLKVSKGFLPNLTLFINFDEVGGKVMPHSALSVANATLSLAWGHQDRITPLKLQKFIYISHGFSLAITDEPLIGENVFAWEFGPVIPEIYQEFKRFGKKPINELATVLYEGEPLVIAPPEDDLAQVILKGVWDIYGAKNGYQLANLTHEPDTPWAQTWQDGKGKDIIIKNDLIKEYYKAMIEAIKKQ